ncbi:poly(A)-binding protein-dependent poly(A) ribonuclease [Cordyceps javanica]|nr:poly(A)-binding protein-dependent poly(A) ribonuclease [Cordyceps javanica]
MDDSFGPRLFGHFDFTLLFEHTIFHIVPSSIFLFTLPYYLHKIIKCRPVVRPSWLLWAKLAVAVALAGLQLATVVFWYRSPLNSKVAQAASILSFLSFIGVIVMTYVSHIHFLQPDLFLASYINITLLFDLSLLLSTSESDESAAISLISTDVPGTEELISLLYDSLAMILEVGFGVAVLSIFVGVASVFTIVTAIIVAVLSKRMAKQMGITRKLWNEHIEERVAATSNILTQIKDIKMTGLAPSMETYLNDLRVKEVGVSLRTRRIICITFGISAFADTVTPAIVVAAALFWTRAAQTMSSARFYTILAVVTMIAQPLASFFASLPEWSAGFACLSRIQAYLTQDELKDPRRIGRASSTSSSIATDALGSGATSVALPVQYAIELSGVNVSMDLTGSILRDASIVIKSGEITMIHGSVGCGKSTLLKVMLGEMELRNGLALLRSPSIAFAGQRPWLLNTTIRLNIIGHKAYNHALYQKTIFICALGVDFESLPDGDQTIVGSGGCILSGGQMQRISIARAIYVEADVTILDDPFSSLDRETSALVRIRLISDGNATPNGRTLVMTTSMKQHLVDADTVFRVTDKGHVVALTKQQVNEELEDLARNHRSQKVSPTEYDATAEKPSEPPIVQPTSSDDADDIYNAQRDTVNTYSSLSLYAYFFRPAGVLFVTLWVVAVTLAAVSERLPNIFVRIWLDTDAGNNLYFIGYALLCVAHPLLNCLSAMFFYYYVNAKTANKLHENLVKATFRSTFEFITTEDAGSILNRFSSDTSMATQRVPALIMPTVFRAVSVIIDIGIIGSGAAYAAPAIPFFLGLIGSIQQYYLRTSRQLRVLELDTSKRLIRHFTETAAGIDHIRAFRWQEEVTKEFFSILDLTQKPFYFLYCIQQWLECALDFSSATAAILVVSLALKFSNTASANSMGLALLSLIGFSSTISEWVQASVAMETAFGAVTRIRSYCDRTPSEKYKDGKTPVTSQWPSRGQLELNCVSAFYRDDTMPQFNNATAIIRPGETLGIVGRTGSGKTTVLLSILNLVQYKGTISIDDREIRTVPPDLLRARITTITQGGIHLRGSVKFNLDPFDPAQRPPTCIVTNEMCQSALDRVGLWDIISRRGDLSSRMKGVSLSHGQRQLFQLARAILHHEITGSKIILMDEVTSSLDEDTEARMAAVIENKETLCRNVLIYGHCRYEDQGCTFSHDQNKSNNQNQNQQDLSKKSLNVESPSFTPANLGPAAAVKKSFTSQAANAPSFTPRGIAGNATPVEGDAAVFNPAAIREFTPSFDQNASAVTNGAVDPFNMVTVGQGLPAAAAAAAAAAFNPYAENHAGIAGAAQQFFQGGQFPPQPLQYHLYAPVGPHREDLMQYHRVTHDFFMPEKLREEMQRKSEASLQVINSQLPQLDNFHSLVALDTTQRKNSNIFGYPTWVYKGTSSKTGNIYCLRRIEGFRLTNEHAIRSVNEWKRIDNANVITIHDAFTTRAFGDSSLIFVQDYHPLAKSLAEHHLTTNPVHGQRFQPKSPISEAVLWGYISQIANALKAIHSSNLAARCIDVSKILLTGKNRVRLNACSILDVVQFENRRPLLELQQEDFVQFGRTMLCLATGTLPVHLNNITTSVEQMSRTYSAELRDTIIWLLTPVQTPAQKTIDEFIRGVAGHIVATLDQSQHQADELNTELYRELENGRIARLLMKLGTVNERQEFDGDRAWSENGERYMLKLFRDHVFHQVDGSNNPVLDMGHMLRNLNKLDAGTDEKICLTSRDEQTSFIVSYKELKKQLGSAFNDLQKASKQGRGI